MKLLASTDWDFQNRIPWEQFEARYAESWPYFVFAVAAVTVLVLVLLFLRRPRRPAI